MLDKQPVTVLRDSQWQYDENLNPNQKNFLSALRAALCVISTALDLYHQMQTERGDDTRLSRNRHDYWLQNDDVYKMYYQDLRNEVKDFGESCLHKLMQGHTAKKITKRYTKDGDWISEEEELYFPGDKAAIIFFNKTQNKDRGYVERQELTTPEGIKVQGMAPIILQLNQGKDEANQA